MSCHQRLAHSGSSREGDNCIPSELSHATVQRAHAPTARSSSWPFDLQELRAR
jgi:hypothetical protein